MGLKINGSTSGSIEIDVPAVAGTDTSITIPAKNGGTFIVEESTGNIDLGPLDINGSASDDSVNIDGSGRLLVGTSTARTNFNGGGQDAPLQIERSGDSSRRNCASFVYGNSDAGSPFITLAKHRSSAIGGTTAVQSGDTLGVLYFDGSDGTNFQSGASIYAQVDGTPGTNDMPGRLLFNTTADGASSPTERMRITSGDSNGALFFFNCTEQPSSSVKGTAIKPNGSNGNFFLNATSYSSSYTHWQFYNPNGLVGTIATSGSSTSYNTSSDYRLKENVIPLTGAAERLNQLQVRRFNFIADPDTTVDGFIAHEAQAVVPEAVTGTQDEIEVWKEGEELPDGVSVGDNKLDEDGNTIPVYQGIDQSKLVPLLTAALQEALAKIETLETANASLEARLTALEGGAS